MRIPFSFMRHVPPGSAPVLTSLSSDLADTAGGNIIDIGHEGLEAYLDAVVHVGSTVADIYEVSSGEIRFVVPPLAAGAYPVTVTTAGGTSNALEIYVESNPVVWLDSKHVVEASGAVASVPNRASTSLTIVPAQATPGKRPLIQLARDSFGGMPAIVHDGIDDELRSVDIGSGSAVAQPLTLYFLVEWQGTGRQVVLDSATSGGRIFFAATPADANGSGGNFEMYADAPTGTISAAPGPLPGSPYVVAVRYMGSSTPSEAYVNNPATARFTGLLGTGALRQLVIGTRGSDQWLNGGWALISAFQGAHDATTRTRIMRRIREQYLGEFSPFSVAPGTLLADLDARYVDTSSGLVTRLYDRSGHDFHATAAAGAEPTYVANHGPFGGMPSVYFPTLAELGGVGTSPGKALDQTNDIASLIAGDRVTIFMVSHGVSGTTGNRYYVISKASTGVGVFIGSSDRWYAAASNQVAVDGTSGFTPQVLGMAFDTTNTARVYSGKKTAIVPVPTTLTGIATAGFRLGCWQTAQAHYSAAGHMSRVLIYKGSLPEADCKTVMTGLGRLYGLPAAA